MGNVTARTKVLNKYLQTFNPKTQFSNYIFKEALGLLF